MLPLSKVEIDHFDLEKVMISGLLPPHLLSSSPTEDLRAYVADYLSEEIAAEAAVQNIPSFREFLRVAAISNGELINYVNIGRESGVSHRTVRAYFDILEDTYLSFRLPPWKRSKNRRMILTEKFYMFDIGVANFLAMRSPRIGSMEFGKSLEHYILMEIRAYQAYRKPEMLISFWRTSTGQEVDLVLGDREVALEIKGSSRVHESDLRSLLSMKEDGAVKKMMVVCLEKEPRRIHPFVEVVPWADFVSRLWAGQVL